MHELSFCDALRPVPACVLKIPLAPYSLGHEALLLSRRNALLLQTEADCNALPLDQQIFHLREAVWLCSDPASHRSRLEQPGVLCLGLRWDMFKRRLWHRRQRTLTVADYALALADFRNYLAAGRNLLPALSPADAEDAEAYEIANLGDKLEGGRAGGTPFIAQLITFALATELPRKLHVRDWQDLPYAVVGNLYFTHLENEGRLAIENYREAEERAAMAAHRAAAKREREAEATKTAPSSIFNPPLSTPTGLATAPPDLTEEVL